MTLRNYTTKVPANRSIEEIQLALVAHGAIRVQGEGQQAHARAVGVLGRGALQQRDRDGGVFDR